MNLPLTGGCQCGRLRYEITEPPRLIYACHCTDCQKMTGSAFSMALVIGCGSFRLTAGEPRAVRRTADSGRAITRWVCPDCGSWLCSGPDFASADPAAAQIGR